jgi:isoaspartyl peptidase/L-asparaginase-like protein (Ntn-hydrolase superfamily)
MRIDSARLAKSAGTLANLDVARGLAKAVDRVVTAATALFGADAAGLMLLDEYGQLRL